MLAMSGDVDVIHEAIDIFALHEFATEPRHQRIKGELGGLQESRYQFSRIFVTYCDSNSGGRNS